MASRSNRFQVAVVVDGVSAYGRAILRGATQYANLQRCWVLHKHLWAADSLRYFRDCDGAIVGGVGSEVFDFVRSRCRHTILCSGGGDPEVAPVVALDDEAVGRLAAEHLLDRQLGEFGFYGCQPERGVSRRRLAGFRAGLKARGHDCQVCPVGWPDWESWMSHRHRPDLIAWLKALPKPIGILAVDDTVAHDLAEACLESDIAVPEHVAIIGVNNDDLLCESAWPPLSSVDADYSRVGYNAAKMLDRLLNGQKLTPQERCLHLPPLGVIQRQSTNLLAVGDPYLAEAIRYIREHACDPCDVGDVLRHVPVARRWLERQFMAKLGRSPYAEITRVRIDAAKRMLLQPELRMPDIASRCGYSTAHNFTRVFRQEVHMTPTAYRRAALAGQKSSRSSEGDRSPLS